MSNAVVQFSRPAISFLPIVDDQGRLQEVWAETGQEKVLSRAAVMVAFRADSDGAWASKRRTSKRSYCRSATFQCSVYLDALEAANVHEIFISAHFMSDQIEAFVAERRNKSEVSVIHENQPLGTAGCLGQISHLKANPNSRHQRRCPNQTRFGGHDRFSHAARVRCFNRRRPGYEVEIPFGVVRHDEDGKFLGIDEKPTLRNFVAAGIYYLSSQFCNLVGPGESIDMPDLLNRGRQISLRVGLFPIHEYWRDIGRPSDLQQANNDYGADPSKDGV